MIKDLIKLIPAHSVYVEVFGGSAELLFCKAPSRTEVYNDINGDLVNLFLQVRDNHLAVAERLKWLPHSRKIYETWSKDFKTGLSPSDPIERAARFYYILCLQFAGHMYGGWAYGKDKIRWNQNRVSRLNKISLRLNGCQIDCSDFRKLIPAWDGDGTFFFLDPPYLETSSYRQGFREQDHRDLAELLKHVEGKWLLTLNDHPLFLELYSDYLIEQVDVSLSSEKLDVGGTRKTFTNLMIRNYDLGDPSQSILGSYLLQKPPEAAQG